MNYTKKRKVCVVGAGKWGMNHIKTLKKLNALSGIVEKNDELVDYLKTNYPDCLIFKDLDHAVKHNFDGFIIATPPSKHYKNAKLILESGYHLLVEKPITLNKIDAIELNEIAIKNKVNLMVGHLLLFHPAFQMIKKILDDGDLGQLQYIYSNRLNYGTIRNKENVFWSFAPHDIALFQYFFNDVPIGINSNGVDILQPGIHDTTITSFKYKNNKMGHIFVSWLHPFKEHRFIVIGSKGIIHFEDSRENKPLILYNKSVNFDGEIPVVGPGESKMISYEFEFPLEAELKYFIKHLDGSEIKIANGQSAVEVMDILERSNVNLVNGGFNER
jgi:UDP-2-acetamido-3-amino-2,3-dideoxy-glucuronate N-acetyltransferase